MERIRNTIKRRNVLIGAMVTLGMLPLLPNASDSVVNSVNVLNTQNKAWEKSNVSNDIFLSEYKEQLSRIIIGCSYAPEQVAFLNNARRRNDEKELETLYIIREKLGIRDIRYGFRWSELLGLGNQISLERYMPTLNYLKASDVNLTVNDGVIKTFRHPEQHIPASIKSNGEIIPPWGSSIALDSQLADEALNHSRDFLPLFAESYGTDVKIWQRENEPFYKTGVFGLTLGEDYLTETISRVLEVKPNSGILMNSVGGDNTEQIANFFQSLVDAKKVLPSQLYSGIDYYYSLPKEVRGIALDRTSALNIDLISKYDLFHGAGSFRKQIRRTREMGFNIEVTEAQAEPWLDIRTPGNSSREFRFMLIRIMNEIATDPNKETLVRIWGAEGLAKNLLSESRSIDHIEIAEIISNINAMTIAA